ncbi:MAG TPA: hypothetical protein VFV78_08945 [Vicinamibacterales bacterium]|nr:hypothetical protein [Vicinamibacterales bacterium]
MDTRASQAPGWIGSGIMIVAMMAIAGCGPTRFARSATTPGPGTPHLRRVLAIGMTGDAEKRQRMENAIVEQITARSERINATPSYLVAGDILQQQKKGGFPDGTQPSTDDFDSAVVCRVTDPKQPGVYLPGRMLVPPEHYRTIWAYYEHWKPVVFDQDYDEPDRNAWVETELYDMPDGELVYSAMSRRMDPKSAADLMTAVGMTVAKDLQARGLIAGK